jgi:hypothetical protein
MKDNASELWQQLAPLEARWKTDSVSSPNDTVGLDRQIKKLRKRIREMD